MRYTRRMLNKAGHLTRPTLAVTSPARPESAKTASSPRDAPFPKQGRIELSFIRGGWDDSNCARPTRRVRDRALREQGDRPSYPALFFSTLLGSLSGQIAYYPFGCKRSVTDAVRNPDSSIAGTREDQSPIATECRLDLL